MSNDNFNGSVSAAFVETINNPKINTSVALVLQAGANPSVYGSSLTFTAAVNPTAATGTVTFFDGSIPISGNLPLSGGPVSFSTAALGAGNHSITAQYSGDANFNGATSAALVQTVTKVKTEVELELSVQDTAFRTGTPLMFIATVTPTAATGTVTFFDETTAITSPIALNNSTATFTTTTLAVGSHSISARYSGDANFNPSASPAHPLSIK
jgi:hypothetical protein